MLFEAVSVYATSKTAPLLFSPHKVYCHVDDDDDDDDDKKLTNSKIFVPLMDNCTQCKIWGLCCHVVG
jgi:hypothetical protein